MAEKKVKDMRKSLICINGPNFRKYRVDKYIPLVDLSDQSKTSIAQLYKIERQVGYYQMATVRRIIDALGLTTQEAKELKIILG